MNADKKIGILKAAIDEAGRFIEKADAAINSLNNNEYVYLIGSRETASAKRASMDLSNALVAVRK